MKKTIETMLIAACCAITGGRLLAADLFWYGTAGDGLWNTPMSVHLGRGVPTTLPNEKSSFLYTTDGTWDYDAVASMTEGDWTSWNGTEAVAGLAVKIVGSGAGLSIFVR